MTIQYNKAQSNQSPVLVDETSSKTSVYLRKNVVEKTVVDPETEKETKVFEYDEAVLTKAEYEIYKVETTTEQAIAELAEALLS